MHSVDSHAESTLDWTLRANHLMLLASSVSTPIHNSWFHLHLLFLASFASCVNWAQLIRVYLRGL